MVSLAKEIRIETLSSELEALLIEAELINAHQPYYNTLLKDDKSQLYLIVTKEEFPRLLRLRRTDLKKKIFQNHLALLGPFASSYKLNEVLKLLRPIFPWCNKSNKSEQKACFYHHLELCPGACCGLIDQDNYRENINNLIAFLRGKTKFIYKKLEQEMKKLAEEEKFEAANQIKDKLVMIKEITSQDYKLKPNLILPNFQLDQAQEGTAALRRILNQHGIIGNLAPLERIEAYDVSNTQGKQATVSMVTFISGRAEKSEYKYFKIRGLDTPNDYGMLQEAIQRRQQHPEWGRADLIVIDGGRGQLRAVKNVSQMSCPIVSIVKHPDRLVLAINDPETAGKFDSKIINLEKDHPALRLLSQLRDEAHRFAKKQHSRLRDLKFLD